jgi:mycothione reductase
MTKYDLVVLGSGVGLNLLDAGLKRNLKCALVESGKIGGTCLTRGCIPSKVLIYPADIIREAQHAKKVGAHLTVGKIDWNLMAERMWSQINESKEMEESLKNAPGLTFYKGSGEFISEYQMQVQVGDKIESIEGEKFVIASGARSVIPPIKGLEETGYITSETFFGEKFPKKPWKGLAIIGGGIIAAEFAHLFSAIGTKVTVIEMLPRLVSTEEPEISRLLEQNFQQVMSVLVNKKAVACEKKKNLKVITVEDVTTGKQSEVSAEEILVATGRRSNSDLLKVEKTGVEVDKRGWIKTNAFLETTKANIWCVGDANGLFQFRHKANYEAAICAQNLFSKENERTMADYSAVPWAIYTYPSIGHVGLTEKEALDQGFKIYIALNRYSSVAKGFSMGFNEGDIDDGLVKIVVDQSHRILGAHIIGPHADILIQPFVYLMNAGFVCDIAGPEEEEPHLGYSKSCPESGSFMPIYRSQVIHPSLNEVTAWAFGSLRPVNIETKEHHHHQS